VRKYFYRISAVILLAVGASACTPVTLAVGAGTAVGTAAMQEGGITTAAKDTAIKLKISDAWIKYNFDMYRNLNMNVKEGRVLITGVVPNPDMRVEAVRLAWKVDGVKQVLNEINVENNPDTITTLIKDSVITGSLRTKIMFDKHINSINYNVDTNNGNIYLMGVAKDQEELDRVIDYARNTSNVSNVINYVRLKEESLKNIEN